MNAASGRSRLALWLSLVALVPVLAGCFPVAVVGVSAGALMVADRRMSEAYLADEAIEMRATSRINEMFGTATHVNVTSYNRMVLLSGEVLSQDAKAQVEKIVSGVPNVRSISNELIVAQASTLGGRSNDAFITSKVKARFVDYHTFSPNHVKVVTEWGTVFLLGLVTQKEADSAVDITRTTSGVQKVVRLFEIIPQDEADRLDFKSNSNPAPNQPN
ncbi:MAG TPA: BON domain-containing protein [Rhodocyclaceae bacterium]|nr:BON domain-containing protein [Rhodocyclaceae bacterium]